MRDYLAGLEARYRFVFYDQRGSLRSPCAGDCPISVRHHVEDLERLRKEIKQQRLILIGHSMGTYLAYEYNERYRNRVSGLVLLGALPFRGDHAAPQASAKHLLARSQVERELESAGLLGKNLTAKQRTHAWRVRFAAANLFHVERWRLMPGGGIFYSSRAAQEAGRTTKEVWDFAKSLKRIPCFVAVINGDHDYVDLGSTKWKAMIEEIPRASLTVIENAGHLAIVDNPDGTRAAIRESLDRIVGCRPEGP